MANEASAPKRPGLFGRTVRHHWVGLIVVTILGSAAVAFWIKSEYPPLYKASSILRVEPLSTALYGVHTTTETFETFLQTQVQLLTSPNVLTAAGANPQAAKLIRLQQAKDVVQELKKNIIVTVLPGTTLIDVSMTSPDAQECSTIVNAVVDAYLATNEEWADGMTRKQIEKLETYLRDLRNKTEELERRWKELAAKGDVNRIEKDNDGWKQMTLEQFRSLQNAIFAIRLELTQSEAWVEAIKADAKATRTEAKELDKIVERKFKNEPEVIALQEKMGEAQAKLDRAKDRAKNDDNPDVLAAKVVLDNLAKQYDLLWSDKNQKFREEIELTSAPQRLDQELRDAETKVRELKAKENALKKMADGAKVVNAGPADEVEIQLILDERSSIKSMQEAVGRRLEQLRYESRGETRVRKVSAAVSSPKPISDKRMLYWSIAPFGVLFATFSLFLVFEGFRGPRERPAVESPKAETTPES